MTSAHGSGVRRRSRPSSSGFSCLLVVGRCHHLRLQRVTAELVPQGGSDLAEKLLLVTRREPREERRGDHRHRHVLGDRLMDRPAPLARVLDERRDVGELVAVLLERRVQQLEQPRAHDGAVAPDAGELVQVDVELRVLDDLEPLGVRLHEAVLDPVVHHLREVSGAGRADVRVAVLGRERREDRLEPLHRVVLAADHETEADLEAPDPAGDAGVDEVQSLLLRFAITALRVAEVRVAAVDDRVALVGELQELLERVLRDLPGRDHHPERARCVELRLQLLERRGRARLDGGIEGTNVVVVLAQAVGHPVAHAAEADHSELHQVSSMWIRATRLPRSCNEA